MNATRPLRADWIENARIDGAGNREIVRYRPGWPLELESRARIALTQYCRWADREGSITLDDIYTLWSAWRDGAGLPVVQPVAAFVDGSWWVLGCHPFTIDRDVVRSCGPYKHKEEAHEDARGLARIYESEWWKKD